MNTAFIALGANLGDPAATVKAAFAALANLPDSRIVHCSSLYRTAPVGITEQPEFVNAVAQQETDLAPEALRLELACALYAWDKVGKTGGAELAGVDLLTFQRALGERGLASLTLDMLEAEAGSLRRLFPD